MSPTPALHDLAAATPPTRNRSVDFLRAASIGVVMLGHWLMAAVQITPDGTLERGDLLGMAPWLHPITWVLQVMPIFFVVGGYANLISWTAARNRGLSYSLWLRGRIRRLVIPLLPLMIFWAVVAPSAHALGVSGSTLRIASMASLVPTWFLAVYLLVVALTPLTALLWQRFGWASILGGFALASMVDYFSLTQDSLMIGFLNYVLVWGTVHQLGYAWRDGALQTLPQRLGLSALGFAALLLLVALGPYGISMVGVSGYGVDNSYPARVTLGFLGLFQAGLVMALEPWLERMLASSRLWMATIFVNARIMTLYLWHLTALGIAVALSSVLGGFGLGLEPDTGVWWATRPLWFLLLGVITAGLVLLMGRFEQAGPDDRPDPGLWRPLLALICVCAAVGVMADLGIATKEGRVHWYLPLVPVAACALGGVVRLPRSGAAKQR